MCGGLWLGFLLGGWCLVLGIWWLVVLFMSDGYTNGWFGSVFVRRMCSGLWNRLYIQ